jgi:ribonuclease HII
MTPQSKNNNPDLVHEFQLRNSGCSYVAGLDEAGRGAWAGPVVAAAVMLPLDMFDLLHQLEGIRDSKLMTPLQRFEGAGQIRDIALDVGIGSIDAEDVDKHGIIESTRRAMRVAIESLEISPLHLLIDHIPLPEIDIEQTVISKGDLLVLSIAAASVIAKVTRDNLMIEYERKYPGYGFSRHKGYGTRQHQHALAKLGPSTIHRYSFKPVAARSLLPVHS